MRIHWAPYVFVLTFSLITEPLCGAVIEPSDLTGSFGTDPVEWGAVYTPNQFSTIRTTGPWNRPTSSGQATTDKTTFQAWDIFTTATAGAGNAPNNPGAGAAPWVEAPFNPNGTASVAELTGSAFLTGGGNIYSFAAATSFQVTVPNYNLAGMATNYLLQLRTQGTPADFSTFQINGQPLSSQPNYSLQTLYTQSLGGFGGDLIDYKLEFTLPSNNALDTLTFTSAGSSMSFDKLFIDTQAVGLNAIPEPTTWACSLMGLGGLIYLARRKRIAAAS